MDTTWWIVIAVAAAIVLVALAGWAYTQSRRRSACRISSAPNTTARSIRPGRGARRNASSPSARRLTRSSRSSRSRRPHGAGT